MICIALNDLLSHFSDLNKLSLNIDEMKKVNRKV